MSLEAYMSGGHAKTGNGHHKHAKDKGHDDHGHAAPKHIDDFFESLKHSHDDDVKKSLHEYREFSKEENQNHFFNNVFTPAQDMLYQKVVEELEHVSHGHDETKTHKKKEGIQKAVVQGLIAYFEKSQPSIAKAIKDHEMNDEEKYKYLTTMYDDHVGAGTKDATGREIPSLSEIADLYSNNKKLTVGHLKKTMRSLQVKHSETALAKLVGQKIQHVFGKYHPTELSAYVKPLVEEAGLEIKDKVKFATLKTGDYIQLIGQLEEGNFGKEGYAQYGLKKKGKGEKHEEHEEHGDAHAEPAHH